jgi:hypothetical protein
MAEHMSNMADNVLPSAQRSGAVVPSICVFDVNETLLDIEFIAPLFKRLFGDSKVLREWFGQLILYSEAITLSGPYTTFFTLAQGVLKMLGAIHNVSIQKDDIEELRTRLLTMPAHPDVPAGLKQLKDAGFRPVTLTNSPPDPTDQPAKARRHRRLVRKVVQRRSRAPIQTRAAGLPHGRRRIRCATCRDLHGGGACLGYDRSAEHRLLGCAHRQTWQCPFARAWVAAAAGCCAGSSRRGNPINQALALMR